MPREGRLTLLASLGFDAGEDRVMLVEPPDSVLAEAAAIEPRPSVASSLKVAEPALRIAWWPQRSDLTAASLSRLAWMVTAGGEVAEAWLVLDDDDDSPTLDEVTAALEGSQLHSGSECELGDGVIAVKVTSRETTS